MNTEFHNKKIRLVLIATVPRFFVHLINNIKEFEKNNIHVQLVTSREAYGEYLKNDHGFNVDYIEIPREISPINDLKALFELYRYFKKGNFDVAHSLTPKGGLLVAIAAFLARVPVRLHTFTGQRWATLHGLLKWLLKSLDKLVIKLNTQTYADSNSQIEYLIQEGVAKPSEILCIHKGSLGGVDIQKFHLPKEESRLRLSQELNIPTDAPWILFLGRVTKDKGINELVRAFEQISNQTQAYLIVVGPFEQNLDPVDLSTLNSINNNKYIKHLGFQNHPEKIIAACDFLCLPSYREGFGTVIIEAAAAEVCTLGSDIPGIRDSIVNNHTGKLFPLHDDGALTQMLLDFCENKELVKQLSKNSYLRAKEDFDFKIISQHQILEYRRLTQKV